MDNFIFCSECGSRIDLGELAKGEKRDAGRREYIPSLIVHCPTCEFRYLIIADEDGWQIGSRREKISRAEINQRETRLMQEIEALESGQRTEEDLGE